MSQPHAPYIVKWIAEILWTIPAPTQTWADILGHMAWPAVTVFLVFRFRISIRRMLNILIERFKTDHVKTPLFELTPNSQVMVLDPDEVDESTDHYESADIQRIEAIFAFIGTEDGWEKISRWINQNFGQTLDIEDFVTSPDHAKDRERAFIEIEGLEI
ncbi:hypothetical protein [Sphingobium sp. BHU LFT2]|uniref:hypothetical protein n=1 Tax=unclassified Sphingobium TaxID=2611147 RepID=UPI001BEAC0EF|nr:hypothetical protein [Sphingobium sp. BHU LFT2]MBT2246181.1 hypothetical protein [Sphingobium sp. BHU LFT2]